MRCSLPVTRPSSCASLAFRAGVSIDRWCLLPELSRDAQRGCIFGLANGLHEGLSEQLSDEAKEDSNGCGAYPWKALGTRTLSQQLCSKLAPLDESGDGEDTSARWLSCVAGTSYNLAFEFETGAITDDEIRQYCRLHHTANATQPWQHPHDRVRADAVATCVQMVSGRRAKAGFSWQTLEIFGPPFAPLVDRGADPVGTAVAVHHSHRRSA